MRSLERNKVVVWYALYNGMQPVLDEWGNDTGQVAPSYSNPLKIKIRVSPNKGESQSQAFGLSLDYDRTMVGTDTPTALDKSACAARSSSSGMWQRISRPGATVRSSGGSVSHTVPSLRGQRV